MPTVTTSPFKNDLMPWIIPSPLVRLKLTFILAFESVPLVEKLLGDLIKTTEGFQRLKQLHSDSNRSGNTDAAIKNELERLQMDNNTLHQAMIRTKENCE